MVFRYIPIMIVCMIILAACSQATTKDSRTSSPSTATIEDAQASPSPTLFDERIRPTMLPEEQAWQTAWLRSDPCAPPCWQGILPGVSTLTETLSILNQQDFLVIDDRSADESQILWSTNAQTYGSLTLDMDLRRVTSIQLPLNVSISFQDLQDHFGSPSHMVALHHRNPVENDPDPNVFEHNYQLYVLYETSGFVAMLGRSPTEPVLDSTLMFDVVLFTSSSTIFDILYSEELQAALVPWTEGKTFAWYCNQIRGYDPCR